VAVVQTATITMKGSGAVFVSFSVLFWVVYNELLIYGPIGGSATLSSVTAAINAAAAAAADPNAPDMSTAPEIPATPQNTRPRRRIAPKNISTTPRSVASGRVAPRPAASGRVASHPVFPAPAPQHLRERAQNRIHSKLLHLFDVRN
jgi:hypothetical protein